MKVGTGKNRLFRKNTQESDPGIEEKDWKSVCVCRVKGETRPPDMGKWQVYRPFPVMLVYISHGSEASDCGESERTLLLTAAV